MKIVEEYVFEEGDIFTGKGEGGYLMPETCKMLISDRRYAYIKELGINDVYLCCNGTTGNFQPTELKEHLKRGNLIYLGNAIKGNGK